MRASLTCSALLLALACAPGPTGPDIAGQCVASVRVQGTDYHLQGGPDVNVPESQVSPEVFATVSRNVGCNDTIEPGQQAPTSVEWQNGDSNFLPAGSTLHAIEGSPTSERLAVNWQGVWRIVVEAGSSGF